MAEPDQKNGRPLSESADQNATVSISGVVGSVNGDIVGRDKITGSSVEELVAVLESRGLLQAAETAGLQRKTIITLARRLRPDESLDFEQAIAELERAVEIAVDVIGRGERGTNESSFMGTILARVAERLRNDDLDGGSSAIDLALSEDTARYRHSQIALLEEGIKVDTLRRDATAVAKRIESVVAIQRSTDRAPWAPEFVARCDELLADSEARAVNFPIVVAVGLARRMVETARNANERGGSFGVLGNALTKLGEREVGRARLEEAVEAFHSALKEYTRGRNTLLWAMVQNCLGNALKALGEREVGTARLEEALAAYYRALEERTRERVPLLWGTTQNNLGTVLRILGERKSEIGLLEKAVVAFRLALMECTRERAPVNWAATQSNLGSALSTLGELDRKPYRLEEAIIAYRLALTERTQERIPLGWAMTQNNLGNALVKLAESQHGTDRLQEAVVAFQLALQQCTRERVPLNWAMTQANLGRAFLLLGLREGRTDRLIEAIDTCNLALKECTRERAPLYWANIHNTLGDAFLALGERQKADEQLIGSIAAYRTALQERTRERVPTWWAATQGNLANGLWLLGQREDSRSRLEDAVKVYDACLTVHTFWTKAEVQAILRRRHAAQTIIPACANP